MSRRTITISEDTFNALVRRMKPREGWDDLLRRLVGLKSRWVRVRVKRVPGAGGR